MRLSDNAIKVLEKRYLAKDESGNLIETPEELFRRVARTIAKADSIYDQKADIKVTEDKFYHLMTELEFLPNSPTLMNAGRPLGQLSACFVLPIPDSMEGIFDAIKNAALIHKSGGGTGFSFSRLRPKGSTVNTTGGVASGPVSFMKVFNSATEAVKQGGTRRGANMGILRADHPDILEFIKCKQDSTEITNFNISVGITESFMNAVEHDEEYELIDPHTLKAVGKARAKEVFDLIVEMAWKNGEPGIIFLDRLNKDNITPEIGAIESTNPCVTKDTWVLTDSGPRQVSDILNLQMKFALNGEFHDSDFKGFIQTGTKNVIRLLTDKGFEISVTRDHLIRIAKGDSRFFEEDWKAAGDINIGERIVLSNNRGIEWENKGTLEEGYLLGMLIGDGIIKEEGAVISVWGNDENAISLIEASESAAATLNHRSDFRGFQKPIAERSEHRMKLASIRDLAYNYGITSKNKVITKQIEEAGYEFYKGFLRGIFDTDGTVIGTQAKGISVRLWQNDVLLLNSVQRMLARLGIISTIYLNRKKAGLKSMPDGKGGSKEYKVQNGNELVISNNNLTCFMKLIGFSSLNKMTRLKKSLANYKRSLNREVFTAKVVGIEEKGMLDVYDVQIPGSNAFDANGVFVHNCGEQPLLPYESCNLGSINLSIMTKEVDGTVVPDFERLEKTIHNAVHFLDNVIDVNKYPLPEIHEMTLGTRKIGLGVMGWADMLCKLRIAYNTESAIVLAEKVMQFINEKSKEASQKLAFERGAFPYNNKSIYKDSETMLRNATTTTIAPTGTLSIIAGVSGGIEPLFAISYIRNVMDNNELIEVNPFFKEIALEHGFYSEDLMRNIAKKGSVKEFNNIPEDLRKTFVTSHEITPEWHVKMQAAFQKHTDNAVSKTVNLSNKATISDVRDVFLHAYNTYCKGVTIYRDGSRDMQVLNIGEVKGKSKIGNESKPEPAVLTQQVTPRPRPEITTGFTEKVRIGCGNLYITVNYDEQGICEVFTNLGRSGGCPSQSEATSRLVSMALRSGVDVKVMVEQLKGIRCHSTLRNKDGVKVLSCPDAIGSVLEKVMKMTNGEKNVLTDNPGHKRNAPSESANQKNTKNTQCPECKSIVEHESGCLVCRNCGYSKCG